MQSGKLEISYALNQQLWEKADMIYTILNRAYEESRTLSNDMLASGAFTGQSKDEVVAFSKLLDQYYGAFVGGCRGLNSTFKARLAQDTVLCQIETFTQQSECHKKLENIK